MNVVPDLDIISLTSNGDNIGDYVVSDIVLDLVNNIRTPIFNGVFDGSIPNFQIKEIYRTFLVNYSNEVVDVYNDDDSFY